MLSTPGAMAVDIANFFFRDDVDEAEKNLSRQLRLVRPERKIALRRSQMDPKLFIAAKNFCSAPQCAYVNVLKHRPSSRL